MAWLTTSSQISFINNNKSETEEIIAAPAITNHAAPQRSTQRPIETANGNDITANAEAIIPSSRLLAPNDMASYETIGLNA
jgi:hypothetical protein